MEIKLTNSLTRSVDQFRPLSGSLVRMYSCGPTVYNYAHIGNMRAFLFADLLQRTLRVVGGYEMRWVMNITDIDDKTIRDSALGSGSWLPDMGAQTSSPVDNLRKLTDYYMASFIEDITRLGIDPGHFHAMPRATDYIGVMQSLIMKIIENGYAYVSDGSVYFDVNKWRQDDVYGRLFKIDFENFRKGERIDSDQYEREQVSDFALWKARKADEPAWDFIINGENYPGRPGWHIECSAMEFELLGLPFDIHTGGVDLKFPHHEDEIAQSKAGYGIDPTAFWCHNEFLEVEGEKMSKSLGNFFTLRDLIGKGLDPLDIRFAMFSVHYGSKYNFTFDGISASHKARFRVQDYIHGLYSPPPENAIECDPAKLREQVFSELADDLHTPKALAHLFTFMNTYPAEMLDAKSKQELTCFFAELNEIFNAWQVCEKQEEAPDIPGEVIRLAEERLAARASRNYIEADRLRDEIQSLGYIVKDTKDSYQICRI